MPKNDELLRFPDWARHLEDSGVNPADRAFVKRAVIGILSVCKRLRRPLSVGLIKWHLEHLPVVGVHGVITYLLPF